MHIVTLRGHGNDSGILGRVATTSGYGLIRSGVSLAAVALGILVPSGVHAAQKDVPVQQSVQVAQSTVQSSGSRSRETAAAQDEQSEEANSGDEITVTGTRVARDGFKAPTPVTVANRDQINETAPENLADFVNDIPSVVGSLTPTNSNLSFSNGQSGLSALNLRGIGTVRTLVLLDGQRSVASAITGVVDVSNLPQDLVERVEIVTGGASAAYGSDAVSGVVNFILNRKFTGIKAELSQGITTYGDGHSWKASLTGGTPFAGGRGHVLLSGELSRRPGIYGYGNRDWLIGEGDLVINNPAYTATNGQPERLVKTRVGNAAANIGGIITNTALRGTAFGPGGASYQYNYGELTSGAHHIGGDWRASLVRDIASLDQEVDRESVFGRASFDITDNINAFVQASWNHTKTGSWALRTFSIANITVRSGNPFIPNDVQSRMTSLGIPSFALGSFHGDLRPVTFAGDRTVKRFVGGLNGDFEVFGSNWTWDAYYQKGITDSEETGLNVYHKASFANAINVVRNPATGQPACAVNVDAVATNDDVACVPYNVMGTNVNSQAAVDYLLGGRFDGGPNRPARMGQDIVGPNRDQRFKQDVVSVSFSGSPFSIWAGPVSLAFGGEHRKEAVSGSSDPISLANGWFVGNYLPTFGSYKVTEGFVETVVPLLEGFEINAAVRGTNYSTSGYVTTWKLGATYQPLPDIRFRATRSRDIRAPNLNELFAAGTANTNTVQDPFNGNAVVQYQGLVTGNPALTPEIADTVGLGVVFQPRFVPGFNVSLDYYDIKIGDALGNIGPQTIVDNCFRGEEQFCAAITRGTGPGGGQVIQQIRISPFNFVEERYRGLDFEASYRTSLSNGDLTFRMLATRYLEAVSDNGLNAPTESVNAVIPKLAYRGSVTYRSEDGITLNVTGRGIDSGVLSNSLIECSTGCPTSTADFRTIDKNYRPGAFYIDTSLTSRIGEGARHAEFFLSIQNLLNKDPGVVPQGPAGIYYGSPPTNLSLYDVLGRTFRAGVRLKM